MSDHDHRGELSTAARRRIDLILLALVVIAIDQVAKVLATAHLDPSRPIELVGSLLRLVPAENSGGIFGLFPGSSPLFALLSATALVLLALAYERAPDRLLLTVGYGALIGGALGNLLDRISHGAVLDFIDLGLGDLRIPLFNLADLAISLGVLALLLASWPRRRGPSQI